MKRIAIVLVCGFLGAVCTPISSQEKKDGGIVVDKEKKTVTIDAKMAPRKVVKDRDEIFPLEVIATWPYPKGKKAHETIVNIDESIKPSDLHKALESLGLKAGTPVMGDGIAKGPTVNVYFVIPDSTGLDRKVTLDRALMDSKNGKPFPKSVEWRFTGSVMTQPDLTKNEKVYGADFMGTFLVIFPVAAETVLQSALSIENEKFMKLEVNTKVMPKVGTPVKLVIEVVEKK
jgi:hypothetical protein